MALCGVKGLRFLGPNVYSEAPDGGWGWVVAVAFFLVEVFTYGTIKIFGIFLQDLMEEFGENNSKVSWIVSICVFVMTFNAPLSSVLINRFGFQLVVMTGGFLIATGTIATSFTGSINQMYITYGLIAGMGYCLSFLPTVTLLSQYFTRRRSLVTALASTGEPLSIFAMPPAFSALKNRIGWRYTLAVIGSLQSIIIICGVLLRPIIIQPRATQGTDADDSSSPRELEALSKKEVISTEDSITSNTSYAPTTSQGVDSELTSSSVSTADSGIHSLKDRGNSSPEEKALLDKDAKLDSSPEHREYEKEEKTNEGGDKQVAPVEENKSGEGESPAKKFQLLDFTILRECSFIFYSLFGLFATLGFFAPQLYIIELSVSRGVPRDRATFMLSTMAVAEVFGRFSIGWIMSQRRLLKRKLLVLLVCVITMTLDLVGFALVVEFYGLAACCALYGFLMGTIASTHIPMLAEDDVVGVERMSSAAGVYVFIQSFAGLGGPPLGGMLVDVTQNYGSAFYSCAAGMAVSALFLGLVRPARRGLICKRKNSQRREDLYQKKENADVENADVENTDVENAAHKLDERTEELEDCCKTDDILVQAQAEDTRDVQEVIRFA
ncbi:uncharacterized protein V6R79_018405 [Siganus canaliculatus]